MLWAGDRLIVKGRYDAVAAFSEPDSIDSAIPGLNVRYYRGAPQRLEDRPLAEVFRALLHALADKAEGSFPPIGWELARYETETSRGTPWPAVQWPQRADVHAQIDGWHSALDRRDSPAIGALIREYVSTTVDVFEFGRPTSGSPGSWQDVLTRALRVAQKAVHPDARVTAYSAWTEQLVHFALPPVGLSHKDVADILIRLWDLNPKIDPRSELRGHTDSFGETQVNLHTPTDHPVLRLLADKNIDVPKFMDELRDHYELGGQARDRKPLARKKKSSRKP